MPLLLCIYVSCIQMIFITVYVLHQQNYKMLVYLYGYIVSGATSTTLIETNEPHMRNATQTQAPQETFTTPTSKVTDSRNLVSQGSENTTFTKTEPTSQTVQSPNSATVPQSTSLMEVIYSQTTTAPGSIVSMC